MNIYIVGQVGIPVQSGNPSTAHLQVSTNMDSGISDSSPKKTGPEEAKPHEETLETKSQSVITSLPTIPYPTGPRIWLVKYA
jgi:hypothetical protein